jgi:hypothetical protein
MDRKAAVYSAPECPGTRQINSNEPGLNANLISNDFGPRPCYCDGPRSRVFVTWTIIHRLTITEWKHCCGCCLHHQSCFFCRFVFAFCFRLTLGFHYSILEPQN